MIRIAPDRAEVFVIKMNFHIADDARGAGLDFVVPVTVLEPLKKDLNRVMTSNEATLALWARYMYDQVLDLPIEAQGILPLGEFTVGELSRLSEGMLIELSPNALEDVNVQVETIDGPHVLNKAKLGVAGRNKALRMLEDPDPQFVQPLLEMNRPR